MQMVTHSSVNSCPRVTPKGDAIGNCEEELPKKPVGRLSAVCRPTVGRQTADRICPKYRLPVGRQWTDSRPTVGNVSVTCR